MTAETPTADAATTHVVAAPDRPAPVFVDTTGRRRRRIRLAFFVLGGVSAAYAGLVGMSFVGGPINPQTLIPFPNLVNRPAAQTPAPTPGGSGPNSDSAAPRQGASSGNGPSQPADTGLRAPAGAASVTSAPSTSPTSTAQPAATPAQASPAATPPAPPTPEPTPTPTPSAPAVPTPAGTGPAQNPS